MCKYENVAFSSNLALAYKLKTLDYNNQNNTAGK